MADQSELEYCKELARALLSAGRTIEDDLLEVSPAMIAAEAELMADLQIPFPAGLAPVPKTITPSPQPGKALPRADVVAITWTVAERDVMADLLTPGRSGKTWFRYNRRFAEFYDERIRAGAPSKRSGLLGSYFLTEIGGKSVLCFKSELHLNQDGIQFLPTERRETPPYPCGTCSSRSSKKAVRRMCLPLERVVASTKSMTWATCW